AGDGVLTLAERHGTSRAIINSILRKAGIKLRTASEQEVIKWSRMDDAARRRQVVHAHISRRGQVESLNTRLERALRRYELQIVGGKREDLFAKLLDAAGIEYRRQEPCGVYSLDFA